MWCTCVGIDLHSLAWRYFQDILLSEESKSEESKIFEFLIHKAGIDPEERVVAIDDRQNRWDWGGGY